MAIEKTNFIATTESERLTEIYNWLNDNASDLFKTITNEGSTISCNISENSSIIIAAKQPLFKIVFENGDTNRPQILSGYFNVNQTYNYAIKTDNGIFLKAYDAGTSTSEQGNICVSKAIDGSIVVSHYNSGDYYNPSFSCPEKSINYIVSVKSSEMTAFVSIPFAKGCYCEEMLWTPFSQFPGMVIEDMTDNLGTHYFYDGFCALTY